MYRLFRGGNRKALMKYLLIFFLGIVSIGMVLTLAPIPGRNNMTSGRSNVLAVLNKSQITVTDLQRAVGSQLQNGPSDAKTVDHLAHSALNQLVMQQVLLAQARKMGLTVSDQELADALRQIPYLYQNGQFIGMQEYQALIQEETGMTVPEFEGQLRESLLLKKVREVVTDEVEVTPAEVHAAFLQQNEKAQINYVVFEPSQFFSDVEVTPQALNQYFLLHREKYAVPEEREVKYVLVTADAVSAQAQVTNAELQNYYNQHLQEYRVPSRVKVSHILFKTTGETPQQKEQTLQLAQKVLAQVKAGGDFAALARKYSQDPGSAQNGGELGWVQRGQTVKPFEDAAFSMKPGEISNLVKTQYGYHIIKVEDRQSAHVHSFDKEKGSIKSILQQQTLAQAQNALATKIQNAAEANPQHFDAVAKQFGLQSGQTPLFAYNQAVPDLGNNQAFENLAFQLPVNSPGQPIQVPKGVAVIMVTKIVPQHLPSLAEAGQRVEQDFRAKQAIVVAAQKAKDFAAQVKDGNLLQIAKSDGYAALKSKGFTQQAELDDLIPGSSLASAFTMNPGQTRGPVAIGSTRVVFQVVSHTPANEADFAAQKDSIENQLLQQMRDLAFEVYENSLRHELMRAGKLKINNSALKDFIANYQTS